MQRFAITTLGCKVNQYDAQSVADMLRRGGWRPASKGQAADLVVIQTCCITSVAMRKSRQTIRRMVRRHAAAGPPVVCVLGCYGVYDEPRLHALLAEAGVDVDRAFVAPADGDPADVVRKLAGMCPGDLPEQTPVAADRQGNSDSRGNNLKARRRRSLQAGRPGTRGLEPIDRFDGHQRAFVKVQDGCDAFCSYCVVPYTRPHVWSRPSEEIIEESRRLIDAGHREVVLCGVFLGAYGRDTTIRRRWPDADRSPLATLLERIADLDGLWRVRLSSLEPGDLTADLLDVLQHPHIAPHLHLPLQSGSAEILRRMNRQYTPEDFSRTAAQLRERLDRPALTTDIIVGFPGESPADFQATCDLAGEVAFSKIHAFRFSAIEPTRAWQRREEAPSPETVRQRMDHLANLEADLAEAYRGQFVGQTATALVEGTLPGEGLAQAMTDRYLTVTFPGEPTELAGQLVDLNLTGLSPDGLAGQLDV